MISNNVPEDEQGEALGLDLSVYAMATAFTPMIATAIYFFFKETFGNPSYTFALLAVMPLIGFVSLARLSRGYDKNKLREKSI